MNIIVTGASSGIGYELVKELSKKGVHKIIALARTQEALSRLESECHSYDERAEVIPFSFDLLTGDYDRLKSEVSRIFQQRVDILINNAGALSKKPISKLEDEDYNMMFGVNIRAPFLLSKKLIPLMPEGAHIVNISSMAGYPGSVKFPGMTLYSASKGAVASFTEALSVELQPEGIAVNCLAIGAVDTRMMRKAFPEADAPLQPSEMAAYIADFAVNGNRIFNGKVLPVALSTP